MELREKRGILNNCVPGYNSLAMEPYIKLNNIEKFATQRYLNVIYQSIGRPVEIGLGEGSRAYGIFYGFIIEKCLFKIKNFCTFQSESVETDRVIHLSEISYIHVITHRNNPVSCELGHKISNNSIDKSLKNSKKRTPIDSNNRTNPKPQLNESKRAKKNSQFENDDYNFKQKLREKKEEEKISELLKMISPSINDYNLGMKSQKLRFQTDSGIAKKKKDRSPKIFQKLEVDLCDFDRDLESEPHNSFDQFAINKSQFQVGTEFNENEYTTFFDINSVPEDVLLRAKKMEEDIKKSAVFLNSRHIMEERGLLELSNNHMSEESPYSVVRKVEDFPRNSDKNITNPIDKPKICIQEYPLKLRLVKLDMVNPVDFRGKIERNFESNIRFGSDFVDSLSLLSDGKFEKPHIPTPKNSDSLWRNENNNFQKNNNDQKRKGQSFKQVT